MNSKSWGGFSTKNTNVNYESNLNSLEFDDYNFKQDYEEVDYSKVLKRTEYASSNFGAKIGWSSVNFACATLEGAAVAIEHLVDVGVVICATVCCVPTLLLDSFDYLLYKVGDSELAISNGEFGAFTKEMFTKYMDVVSYEAVGTIFDNLYDLETMKKANASAYRAFQRADEDLGIESNGRIYDITKTTSEYVVDMALAEATGGTTAVMQGILVGLNALGKTAESNFNGLKDENGEFSNVSGGDMIRATVSSYAKGTIDGSFIYLGTSASNNIAANFQKNRFLQPFANSMKNVANVAIKAAKPLASETVASVIEATSGDVTFKDAFDVRQVGIDTASTIIGETVNMRISSGLEKISDKLDLSIKNNESIEAPNLLNALNDSNIGNETGFDVTWDIKKIAEVKDVALYEKLIKKGTVIAEKIAKKAIELEQTNGAEKFRKEIVNSGINKVADMISDAA